jgi:aminoethylphosphonate catabolism LysR family transcriptional regulator
MQHVQLRAFHAVAEHGGFSKAAAALHLTQPALSDQVRRLEQEFGVTLFHRRARSVEPTELGRRLLVVTRQMFGCERDARTILDSAGTLLSGSLSLVADAPDLAAALIAAFRLRHPGIRFHLAIANAETCMARVLSSAVDAAVMAARPIDSRLDVKPLRCQPLMAVVPRASPLGGRLSLSFEDCVGQPMIFREPGSLTQSLFEAEMRRCGLRIEPVMVVEGREALKEAVAHGIGIGAILRSEAVGDTRIATLALDGCEARSTDALVCRADRPPSHLIDAFFAIDPTER